jgi:predicted GIY-YIG superfamily endonuclease
MFKYDKWITYEKWHIDRGEFGLMRKQWVVYVIYLNEQLAYVGHTNNLYQRLLTHRIGFGKHYWNTRWGQFADLYIKAKFPRKLGAEAMIEKRLINRLKPKYNKRLYQQFKYRMWSND